MNTLVTKGMPKEIILEEIPGLEKKYIKMNDDGSGIYKVSRIDKAGIAGTCVIKFLSKEQMKKILMK